MLHQSPLTQEESDHLAHCPTCMQDMVKAVRKEIGVKEDDKAAK